MKINLKNEEILNFNNINAPSFPKYTSQLINWANQNAQGTRPKMVGQLSDLFPEYEAESENISINGWKEWYIKKYPDAMDKATDKIFEHVDLLKEAIQLIDREMVFNWVEDLVIAKTYNGLYVQEAILSKLSATKNLPYRLATPDEESRGIDGYVGNTPYSIKPDSYKTMNRLSETIDVKMIYYSKGKNGIKLDIEE